MNITLNNVEPLVAGIDQRLQSDLGFYNLNDGGVERHGSLEWTWVQQETDVKHYYVVLGLTESADQRCAVEVWLGADDKEKFGRFLSQKWEIRGIAELLSIWSEVELEIEKAAERVRMIPQFALTGRYLHA